MHIIKKFSVIATLLITGAFSSASLADDIYVYIEGVQGDVTEVGFTDRIETLAFSWGLSRFIDINGGGGGGASAPAATDLSLTKYVDGASAGLAAKLLGSSPSDVVLSVVNTPTSEEYIRIELCQAFVSSISSGGSQGEDKLTENVTVTFASFELTYFEIDGKSGGAGDSVKWDFTTNTAGGCNINPPS